MERKEKLVVVTNKDMINDLRDVTKVYPLKSFCVGYEEEFDIEQIDDFVLINRILTDDDLDILKSILNRSKIKGIVFDDLGIISLVKDMPITKILLLTHLGNSLRSINYYLDYVDSIIVSTDITREELKYITKNVKKPICLFTFGLIPLMYSRRNLLTNYQIHHKIPLNNELNATINDKYFHIIENTYGTCFYTQKYFYLDDYKTYDNVLYYYYNPVFLDLDKIKNVLNDNVDGIDTFNFLLDTKMIYKLKGGEE